MFYGFWIEGPSKFDFILTLWFRVLGLKVNGFWNYGVARRRFSNFCMDFVIHEVVKVCRISKSLQANTQCDHNENKKHCQWVKSLTQQS
jgi:hypothetical protein